MHPVDLDATLTPAQWRWQGASLYVVECGTSNRTEQQLVRLVTSVPGILLTNFILPGRPPREVDGIAILPRGVCTIEAKYTARRGVLRPNSNAAWKVGGVADLELGNPTGQALVQAKQLKALLGPKVPGVGYVPSVVLVTGEVSLEFPELEIAVKVCTEATLPQYLLTMATARRGLQVLDVARIFDVLRVQELLPTDELLMAEKFATGPSALTASKELPDVTVLSQSAREAMPKARLTIADVARTVPEGDRDRYLRDSELRRHGQRFLDAACVLAYMWSREGEHTWPDAIECRWFVENCLGVHNRVDQEQVANLLEYLVGDRDEAMQLDDHWVARFGHRVMNALEACLPGVYEAESD